jgi:hypothetical protein
MERSIVADRTNCSCSANSMSNVEACGLGREVVAFLKVRALFSLVPIRKCDFVAVTSKSHVRTELPFHKHFLLIIAGSAEFDGFLICCGGIE